MAAVLNAEAIGPVDIALILFEGNKFNGDVAPALLEIQEAGIVQILDLAFVRKEEDGKASFLEVIDDVAVMGSFDTLSREQSDLLSDSDLETLADELDPGSSALVVVWENSWSSRLAQAIRGSNGRLVFQERVPRETVVAAITDLNNDQE